MTANDDQKFDWFKILLSGGLLATSLGWVVQCNLTREAQKSEYRLERLSEFKDSGAALDEAIVKLFDALSENADVGEEKKQFKDAYVRHVVKVEADREVLGSDGTERYLQALGVLNREVEGAENATGAGARVEALSEVIRLRREVSDAALDI